MSVSLKSNIPNLLLMIRPHGFAFNSQTAQSNSFQNKEVKEDLRHLAQVEFDAMVQKICDHHIEVKVFDDLSDDLPDSVFSNNWIADLPEKKVILFPMFTENRRAEVRADIAGWVKQKTNATLIDYTSYTKKNQFLEGTGSIVFDYRNKIAYANISPRTSISLFEKLCKEIGYQPVSFSAVDLDGKDIYHTNVVMTIAENYALVCLDAVENFVEKQMLKMRLQNTGHEVIELSYRQMYSFAGNCIEVMTKNNDSCLLMSETAYNELMPDQLSKIQNYSNIITCQIPTIEKVGGGSVRCMITGLFL